MRSKPNAAKLNLCVNNFNRQSSWTFFIVLLKWICRLYLFLHHDSVKSFSKVTVLPGPAVDSRKITLSILTEHAKSAAFWSHEVSLEATTCWRWFHQIKLFSSHACSLKLVSSDSELDKSLSKYSSTFPPQYGRFSHLGKCKQLNANFLIRRPFIHRNGHFGRAFPVFVLSVYGIYKIFLPFLSPEITVQNTSSRNNQTLLNK